MSRLLLFAARLVDGAACRHDAASRHDYRRCLMPPRRCCRFMPPPPARVAVAAIRLLDATFSPLPRYDITLYY